MENQVSQPQVATSETSENKLEDVLSKMLARLESLESKYESKEKANNSPVLSEAKYVPAEGTVEVESSVEPDQNNLTIDQVFEQYRTEKEIQREELKYKMMSRTDPITTAAGYGNNKLLLQEMAFMERCERSPKYMQLFGEYYQYLKEGRPDKIIKKIHSDRYEYETQLKRVGLKIDFQKEGLRPASYYLTRQFLPGILKLR